MSEEQTYPVFVGRLNLFVQQTYLQVVSLAWSKNKSTLEALLSKFFGLLMAEHLHSVLAVFGCFVRRVFVRYGRFWGHPLRCIVISPSKAHTADRN